MRAETQESADLLEKWDDGEIISTVEMGGLGYGYEQALYICAFEMLRYFINNPPDLDKITAKDEDYWEMYRKERDATLWAEGALCNDLGLSGAQEGAAGNVSIMFYRHGPSKAIGMVEKDRIIEVSSQANPIERS